MNNVIWNFATLVILCGWYSKGSLEVTASMKENNFMDNAILNNVPSSVGLPLHSRTKRDVATTSQGSNLSFKKKITLNDKNPIVTSRRTEVSQATDFHATNNNRNTQSPSLSVKVSSHADSGDFALLSIRKDDSETHYASLEIFIGQYKVGNRRHNTLPEKDLNISWHATSDSKPLKKHNFFSSWHYHNKIPLETLKHRKTKRYIDAESIAKHDSMSSKSKDKESIGFVARMRKPEALPSSEESEVSDSLTVPGDHGGSQQNVTGSSQDNGTTEVMHPATQEPEYEDEFVPGMDKLRFITVASTSLTITVCFAALMMYYIRRRRLRRAMDPERQRLIPFRISAGIYYNQSGVCF